MIIRSISNRKEVNEGVDISKMKMDLLYKRSWNEAAETNTDQKFLLIYDVCY